MNFNTYDFISKTQYFVNFLKMQEIGPKILEKLLWKNNSRFVLRDLGNIIKNLIQTLELSS